MRGDDGAVFMRGTELRGGDDSVVVARMLCVLVFALLTLAGSALMGRFDNTCFWIVVGGGLVIASLPKRMFRWL